MKQVTQTLCEFDAFRVQRRRGTALVYIMYYCVLFIIVVVAGAVFLPQWLKLPRPGIRWKRCPRARWGSCVSGPNCCFGKVAPITQSDWLEVGDTGVQLSVMDQKICWHAMGFCLYQHHHGYTAPQVWDTRFYYKLARSVNKHGCRQPKTLQGAWLSKKMSILLTMCPIITSLGTYLQAVLSFTRWGRHKYQKCVPRACMVSGWI